MLLHVCDNLIIGKLIVCYRTKPDTQTDVLRKIGG